MARLRAGGAIVLGKTAADDFACRGDGDDWPDIRIPPGYGNWLELPEVSVPAGYGAHGLPALDVSIVELPGEDAQVLAWAHAFEREGQRFEAPARPV